MSDEEYMAEALKEAEIAMSEDEVPIGCIIVYEGQIIARTHNQKETLKKATGHAEILAINQASEYLDLWHLDGCTMYVTLEPCMMCTAAIELSRIKKVHYLLKRDKEIIKNKEKYIYEETESSQEVLELLQSFFKSKR